MRRAPWTFWWSVFGELWKLLLLSTAVLVTVIAFAAAVPPLADGKLQPADALKFVFLAIPPMLAYALPFAGCFATTLVYHRLASDHEVTAAAAGGISHRAVLFPAVVTGLALALSLAALNEQIIPRFLRQMQQLITFDIAKILTTSINRGQSVSVGRTTMYANRANLIKPDTASGEIAAILLAQTAIIETDEQDRVIREGTAARALVSMFPGTESGASMQRVRVQLDSFRSYEADSGLLTGRTLPPIWMSVPNAFQDDPKFLRFDELRALRNTPENMNWIDARRRALALELAREDAIVSLTRELETAKVAKFTDAAGRTVTLRAGGLIRAGDGWDLRPPTSGRPIEVEIERVSGSPSAGASPAGETLRLSASGGRLAADLVASQQSSVLPGLGEAEARPGKATGSSPLAFRLELREVETRAGSTLQRREFAGLTPTSAALDRWVAKPSGELLTDAKDAAEGSRMRSEADQLTKEIEDLQREVTSKQHERAALAASCAVMVLTGAIMALKLSGQLPLTTYLWSFFPALAAVVTIAGGQQVTHAQGAMGLPVLWSGVAGLAIVTLLSYMQVRRR